MRPALRSVRGVTMVEMALFAACMTVGGAVGVRALGIHVRAAADRAQSGLDSSTITEHRNAPLRATDPAPRER